MTGKVLYCIAFGMCNLTVKLSMCTESSLFFHQCSCTADVAYMLNGIAIQNILKFQTYVYLYRVSDGEKKRYRGFPDESNSHENYIWDLWLITVINYNDMEKVLHRTILHCKATNRNCQLISWVNIGLGAFNKRTTLLLICWMHIPRTTTFWSAGVM